jgi:Lrp/AsnC family leucine-responsive transcriptional regulator
MATLDQLTDTRRRQRNAVLIRLDLGGDADDGHAPQIAPHAPACNADGAYAEVSVVSSEIDDRIIQILVRNGRASFAQIADEVGLSPHAVSQRVRRLEVRGTIQGFTARIDQRKLGRGLAAYVDVRLLPTTDPQKFEQVALALPATQMLAFVTGRFDYIVQLACRDAADLDETVRQLRSRGGVAATETRIAMRTTGTAESRGEMPPDGGGHQLSR